LKADIEIARSAPLQPIAAVAARAGLSADELEPYGRYKAKIRLEALAARAGRPDGKLVLVSAISPTPAGEGKTTTTIGLGMALCRRGTSTVIALREPSLGPCFGVKGGAAGGGHSQVLPMEDINLHFTGDFHAVTSAHNLLAALLDNHLQQGNRLGLDPRTVTWRRVLDMNDRALRRMVIGLGGKAEGVPRETGFDITPASEVMAILCLARDRQDLRERLGRIVVGYTPDDRPVTAQELKAAGAMAVLLKDAVMPNLVQTIEGTPALIHGGPFANIAHGCNTVIATRLALKLGDVVVTEAGFGFDLGGEKFLDIKCRAAGLWPRALVLVATVRALKMHGGMARTELGREDTAALGRGLTNLHKHLENAQAFGLRTVVAINRFPSDTKAEIDVVVADCHRLGVKAVLSEVFEQGSEGGLALADETLACLAEPATEPRPTYALEAPIEEKIATVAREVYGAAGIELQAPARKALARIEAQGYGQLPVCIAKTQYSFSDQAGLLGRPSGFTIAVRELRLSAGAGFVVAVCGEIMTMPGLPKVPAAEGIDFDDGGNVVGLF
jgi:formate--tetrahydrofolate ligase